MELCAGASNQHGDQSARSICRHAVCEPALPDAGERLSDRVRRVLCAVSVRRAERSSLWRGYATQHRGEQPLQRPAANRRSAIRPRPATAGQLHLEPLHGHSLERRIPAVLGRGHYVAAAGTALAIFVDELQYVEEEELAALITALHRTAQRSLPVVL